MRAIRPIWNWQRVLWHSPYTTTHMSTVVSTYPNFASLTTHNISLFVSFSSFACEREESVWPAGEARGEQQKIATKNYMRAMLSDLDKIICNCYFCIRIKIRIETYNNSLAVSLSRIPWSICIYRPIWHHRRRTIESMGTCVHLDRGSSQSTVIPVNGRYTVETVYVPGPNVYRIHSNVVIFCCRILSECDAVNNHTVENNRR